MEWFIADDGRYHVKLPWTAAIDFATYFMERGISTEYSTNGCSGDYRYIQFDSTAIGADIMLAWVKRWEKDHEYCPFCGGVPMVYTETSKDSENIPYTIYGIICGECHIRTGGYLDEDRAWYVWNRRVKEA